MTDRRILASCLVAGLLLSPHLAAWGADGGSERFFAVDLFVTVPTGETLGAWQVELRPECGRAKLVGVEGGEAKDFTNPPYYDPAALAEGERIVLAAFTRGRALGPGRHRIATIHVLGAPARWHARLVAAGDAEGRRITVAVSAEVREAP